MTDPWGFWTAVGPAHVHNGHLRVRPGPVATARGLWRSLAAGRTAIIGRVADWSTVGLAGTAMAGVGSIFSGSIDVIALLTAVASLLGAIGYLLIPWHAHTALPVSAIDRVRVTESTLTVVHDEEETTLYPVDETAQEQAVLALQLRGVDCVPTDDVSLPPAARGVPTETG